MSIKITEKTTLTANILTNILKSGNGKPDVKVGFMSTDQYPDGTYVAQVAYWNEYGTKSTPARPFMRNAIAKNQEHWGEDFKDALDASNGNIAEALKIMGLVIEGQVRDEITSGEFAPNSMTTNLLKDRFPTGGYNMDDFLAAHKDAQAGETAPAGKTLVWTGKMLQSVKSEVGR